MDNFRPQFINSSNKEINNDKRINNDKYNYNYHNRNMGENEGYRPPKFHGKIRTNNEDRKPKKNYDKKEDKEEKEDEKEEENIEKPLFINSQLKNEEGNNMKKLDEKGDLFLEKFKKFEDSNKKVEKVNKKRRDDQEKNQEQGQEKNENEENEGQEEQEEYNNDEDYEYTKKGSHMSYNYPSNKPKKNYGRYYSSNYKESDDKKEKKDKNERKEKKDKKEKKEKKPKKEKKVHDEVKKCVIVGTGAKSLKELLEK